MRATGVILAGTRPGGDPLARAHGIDLKPLIPVAGMPMVRRPVTALLASDLVGRVVVLTQRPERIKSALPRSKRLSIKQSRDTIAATLEDLCFDPKTEWPLLVTTADHALLDPDMIEDFLTLCQDADIAIGVVERRNLVYRLPQAERTWVRFRGGAYTGANLFLLAGPRVVSALELWRSVEQHRKKSRMLFSALGPLAYLSALLRLRTIDQTAGRTGRKLGLKIKAVELADPLAAVDVDKQADLLLAEAILEGRE